MPALSETVVWTMTQPVMLVMQLSVDFCGSSTLTVAPINAPLVRPSITAPVTVVKVGATTVKSWGEDLHRHVSRSGPDTTPKVVLPLVLATKRL